MFSAFFIAASLQAHPFRPPAVPLVTHDPYFSIWSEADHAYDDVTRHWTHSPNSIQCAILIDGKRFNLCGDQTFSPLPQVGLTVTPTRSIYEFQNAAVHVTETFTTPLLPDDLDVLTRPVTYLSWAVRSVDGRTHSVYVVTSVNGQATVSNSSEKTMAGELPFGLDQHCWWIGPQDPRPLSTPGDGTRIDWGRLYLDAPFKGSVRPMGEGRTPILATGGAFPATGLSASIGIGAVGPKSVSRFVILAYDEVYEINYFGQKLAPYWRRHGDTPMELLAKAEKEYPRISKACVAFDAKLTADLTRQGGVEYAQLCALAYRQAFAACGIAADAKGQPLMFTKENTSNGDIATVDVIFPMDPMLIALCPALAKATLVPDLDYASSDHWKFPNAPHDLGTYPIASGTDDGGEGMPVEESGNMLILCDAVSQAEGSAAWVTKWWPKLTQWEKYLEKYGYDPEDQLCTDDFMGHLAHNSNLAIKAILGIAAYGDMCRLRGSAATAEKLHKLAIQYADHWMQAADDGDHTRLAFDKPHTWSQKYNLVWDRILGLKVFPAGLAEKEVDFYKRKLQPFGLPLDSRTHLTKTDWSVWSATLATDKRDFEALIAPIYKYMDSTTNRQPMVDSYVTDDIHSNGMHARPVVGGVFIRMLTDRPAWLKWAKEGDAKVGPWAPFPKRPTMIDVIPTSQKAPQMWRFTLDKPGAGWEQTTFADGAWQQALGPFGSNGTPGIKPTTQWTSDDIWLRREVTVPAGDFKNLQLVVYHDEDVEVYVNGVLAGSLPGYQNSYEPLEMSGAALKLFTPGAHLVLAVHCHQTTGGQGVDIGVVDVR
ncbi:MAG: glutaminase domain-containing protein [Fimbriimonadaceae bacterium]